MNFLERIKKYPIHHALGGGDTSGGLEQNANEFNGFCEWLLKNNIKTVLEIGMAKGYMSKFLREELGIKVDGLNPFEVPGVTYLGKSQDREIIDKVGNYDLIFVDGDHSLVKVDFANYRSKCKFMAFHDVCGLRDCGAVSEFWEVVKKVYPSWEFIDHEHPEAQAGIGVIEMKTVNSGFTEYVAGTKPDEKIEVAGKMAVPFKPEIKEVTVTVTGAEVTGESNGKTVIETKKKRGRKPKK